MQKINLYKLKNFIKEENDIPYIILGEPCDRLWDLQREGYCVIAELKHLQGLSDEEVAEALGREDAVSQYTNVCIDAAQLPQAYLRRIWCRHKGEPVLIAETDRLIIRENVSEDAESFLDLYADEQCRKYLETPPVALNGVREHDLEEYRRYIAQYQAGQYDFYEYGMWSVIEKESGYCIGRVGLELQAKSQKDIRKGSPDEALHLGYALLPQHRGKGYATEGCLAVLDYCKECGYGERIAVKIDVTNEASRRVAKKLGSRMNFEFCQLIQRV